jgi:hypothetical protein
MLEKEKFIGGGKNFETAGHAALHSPSLRFGSLRSARPAVRSALILIFKHDISTVLNNMTFLKSYNTTFFFTIAEG